MFGEEFYKRELAREEGLGSSIIILEIGSLLDSKVLLFI
jgi:hypothetical protein